jgi:prepilin peptidase CpaA
MGEAATIWQYAALAGFCALLAAAAVGDVRRFRISNRLNLAIAGLFFAIALPAGLGGGLLLQHLVWFVLVTAICLGAFYLGAFGGGDAKMIGAVSAWMGPAGLLPFIVWTALWGGVLALLLLGARFVARKTGLPKGPRWLRQILRRKAGVPYGVAIAAGGVMALPVLPWVTVF